MHSFPVCNLGSKSRHSCVLSPRQCSVIFLLCPPNHGDQDWESVTAVAFLGRSGPGGTEGVEILRNLPSFPESNNKS